MARTLERETTHANGDGRARPAPAARRGRAAAEGVGPGGRRRALVVVGCALAAYAILAVAVSRSKAPWHDEGQFASPALTLAARGYMGTPVLEGSAPWLVGIERVTHWVPPLYPATLAVWFKLFGPGLSEMRAYSTAWGLIALLCWLYVFRSLAGGWRVACVAVALLSVDYVFLMAGSNGRMDMMTAGLGAAAYAAYLALRGRSLPLALLASNALVAAAGLTHPAGVLYLAGLLVVVLRLDRRRIGAREAAAALAPYLAAAAGWGWYVAQDAAAFRSQLGGNVNGFTGMLGSGDRWVGLTKPWEGIRLEVTHRYLRMFGLAPHSAGVARLKVLVLAAYVAGIVGTACTRELRRHAGARTLLVVAALSFVLMALLEGHKNEIYLVHMTPLLAGALAFWLDWCWRRVPAWRWAFAGCAAGVVLLQAVGVAHLARRNQHAQTYAPLAAYVNGRAGRAGLVMGGAELGFDLGFEGLIDDPRLGYYSGKRPRLIVVGARYEENFGTLRQRQPEAYRHVERLLAEEYEQVYEFAPHWKVYERRAAAEGAPQAAARDMSAGAAGALKE